MVPESLTTFRDKNLLRATAIRRRRLALPAGRLTDKRNN
jgi:hypothetical protein